MEQASKKYDKGKPAVELVPMRPLLECGSVMGYGGSKYEDKWNHKNPGGVEWSRRVGSALRHLIDWMEGEDDDPESGLSHLAHAATQIMLTRDMQIRGTGTDDRPIDREHPTPVD